MVAGLPQPTKCRVRFLSLGSVRIEELVTDFAVYGSIHSPYLTGKMILNDETNLIENLGMVGEEPVVYSWDAGEGKVFSGTLYVLRLEGDQPAPGLRSQRYTVSLIGKEYFIDKRNLVQQSFSGSPGGSAIKQIHGQFFPTSLSVETMGSALPKEFIISSQNPLTAIDQIRRSVAWGSTGNAMYFRDFDKARLATLEQLIAGASGPRFIQKATWGLNWVQDQVEAQNAIITCVSKANAECGSASQRGAMGDIAGQSIQENKSFDIRQKRPVLNQLAGKFGAGFAGFGSTILGAGGGHGGQTNYFVNDLGRGGLSQTSIPTRPAAGALAASMGNGATFIVTVPIQGGIDLQPGGGAELRLVPPVGDMTEGSSAFSGMYMIVNLCQSFSLDERDFQAISLFSCTRNVRSALD